MTTAVSSLNQAAEHWWLYVFHATWQATLVAAVALALVLAFRRLPSPWRYALLLVALVKFAVPPVMPEKLANWGVFAWAGPVVVGTPDTSRDRQGAVGTSPASGPNPGSARPDGLQTRQGGEPGKATSATGLIGPDGTREAPQAVAAPTAPLRLRLVMALTALTWKSWLMLLHGVGTAGVLAWIVVGFCKLVGIARRSRQVASGPLYERMAALHKRLGLKDEIDLLITDEPIPPVAYWLLRPKIMLPQSLVDSLPPDELEVVLAHELVHHRRNDWAANWLQLLVCAAWWFNPLAWLLNQTMRHTREECCDDALLAEGLTTQPTYSRTLLTAAEQMRDSRTLATTLGFGEHPSPVAKRLKRILDPALQRVPRLSGPALAAAAILCVAVLPGLRSRAGHPVAAPLFPDTLLLTVVDAADKPIANATIEVRSSAARADAPRTDARGQATIRFDAGKTSSFRVIASSPRRVTMALTFRDQGKTLQVPPTYTLKLPDGTKIGGVVRDPQDQPLPDVSVYVLASRSDFSDEPAVDVRPFIWDHSVKTDEQGRWETDIVPADPYSISLRYEHPQFRSDTHYSQRSPEDIARLRDRSAVRVMETGVSLAGTVTDPEGKPIAGAQVLQGGDRFGSEYPSTTTNEAGEFRFAQVAPGTVVLTVQSPGYAPDQIVLNVAPDGSMKTPVNRDNTVTSHEVAALDFKLAPGKTLRGRVVDRNGAPLEGVSVGSDTWRGLRAYMRQVTTDAEGRFIIDGLPEDEIEWDMIKSGYMAVRNKPMRAGEEEYEVTMPGLLKLSGTVTDAATGEPIPEFAVTHGSLHRKSEGQLYWESWRAQRYTGGRFEWSLSEPKVEHYLRVSAVGYKPAESRALRDEEGEVALEFKLEPGSGPAGVVLRPNGDPAAGVTVALAIPGGGGGVLIQDGRINRAGVASVTTDHHGRFILPEHAKPWAIGAIHDEGYARIDSDNFPADGVVRLIPWGRVEGIVYEGDKPAPGVKLGLGPADHVDGWTTPVVDFSYYVTTDEKGLFALDRVFTGRVAVGRHVPFPAEFSNGQATSTILRSLVIDVEPGQTTRVSLGGEGKRDVVGRFVLPEEHRATLEGAAAKWVFSPGFFVPKEFHPKALPSAADATIDPDGRFTIRGVESGLHSIQIQIPLPPLDRDGQTQPRQAEASLQFELAGAGGPDPSDLGKVQLRVVETEE